MQYECMDITTLRLSKKTRERLQKVQDELNDEKDHYVSANAALNYVLDKYYLCECDDE